MRADAIGETCGTHGGDQKCVKYLVVRPEIHVGVPNSLSTWSRVLLYKLSVTHMIKKFSSFYGTRRFVTVFTRVLHWTLSWVKWIQSTPSYPIFSIHFNIILPFMSRYTEWSLHFRYSSQSSVCIFHVCLPLNMLSVLHASHHPWFDNP
jgi:hypothetical protein